MPLTITIVRRNYGSGGKEIIFDADFDALYATGGEPIDFTAAPFTGVDSFAVVRECEVVEGPYTVAAADPLAITIATRVDYDPDVDDNGVREATSGALVAYRFSAGDATGVYQPVPLDTDLSTARVRCAARGT